MRKEFGTYLFRGMNSATAPHLLEDAQLADAQNCDFDSEYGSIKPFKQSAETIDVTGLSIKGAAAMENDGTPLYKTDQDVIHNEGTTLDTGNSNTPFFLPSNDRVYMADSDVNWVYDGTSYRKHGALIPAETNTGFYEQSGASSNGVISGATQEDPCKITCTAPHSLSTGDRIWIKNIVGMTEINLRHYTITEHETDNDKFYLDDVDATNYQAYSSVGNWYEDTCGWGLDGGQARSYGVSYIVEMPNGNILESDLFLIGTGETAEADADKPALEATPSASTDRVRVWFRKIMNTDLIWDGSDGYTTPTSGSGYVVGTDINVHVRIYRNKEGGASYYLLEEMSHADSYETGVSYYGGTYDTKLDRELGTLYGSGDAINGHGLPPVATVMASLGNRVYCNDSDELGKIRFSGAYQHDYYPPNNNIDVEGDVEALGAFNEELIIFSESRAWRFVNTGGGPLQNEIDVPEGTTYPNSVVSTPYGLVYAGERGLYLYRGTTPQRISTPWQDQFEAEVGTWDCDFIDNRLYAMSQGSGNVYVATFSSGAMEWAKVTTTVNPARYLFGRRADENPQIMTVTGIEELFGGTDNEDITMDSKGWRLAGPSRADYVWLDCETSGDGIDVTLLYPGGSASLVTGATTSGRQTLRYSCPIGALEQGYQIRVSGDVVGIYGWGISLYG